MEERPNSTLHPHRHQRRPRPRHEHLLALSLARSVVERLHNQVGTKTHFVTHCHELTELTARLAGVPKEVLDRAKVILRNLEDSELTPEGTVRQTSRRQQDREKLKSLAPPPQLDLFG